MSLFKNRLSLLYCYPLYQPRSSKTNHNSFFAPRLVASKEEGHSTGPHQITVGVLFLTSLFRRPQQHQKVGTKETIVFCDAMNKSTSCQPGGRWSLKTIQCLIVSVTSKSTRSRRGEWQREAELHRLLGATGWLRALQGVLAKLCSHTK